MHTAIQSLLDLAINNKASDVHISVGTQPMIRVASQLVPVPTFPVMSEAEMHNAIMSIATTEQQKIIIENRELDFSVSLPSGYRFRVNAYFSMNKLCCALRIIPNQIPKIEVLGLPPVVASLISLKQGFILFTGPTGHGKSTSVAALLNQINESTSSNIVTIEDPVEYLIPPKRSLVYQREVFSDTKNFAAALRSSLRQDPNVVFVGEMRDLETISSALTIAETGHLVFSTLHTNSAAQTIDRIVDVFPEESKAQIRIQLASVITAIISQRLIPAVNGGLVLAYEVLVANSAVRNSIRESKSFMIDNIIQTSADLGMVTYETCLAGLVKKGVVEERVAMEHALRPGELQGQLRMKRSI